MGLEATLVAMCATVGILGLALWGVRRPYVPGRVWRMPWHAVMALALVLLLGLVAHVISLVTGQPLKPRGFGMR